MKPLVAVLVGIALLPADHRAGAAEALTLENVTAPKPNSPDEPLAAEFSSERAAHFLDQASLDWQKSRQCFTCHTNYAYLMARPALKTVAPAQKIVRDFAEELVTQRWPEKGPRWDAEVVAAAAALALNDTLTTGKLHPVTRTALDRIWTVQREDGGFDWLKCGWPPMENDDEYGALLALIAVAAAPDGYRESASAAAGIEKLRKYMAATPLPTLHHRAMLLWANSYWPGVADDKTHAATVRDLVALQLPDGGWSAASLGDWKRGDDKQQDTTTSDGYGTAFVVFVLRRAGRSVDDPAIVRGVDWLKTHQRASGRWFARSLKKDNKHYLSHAATAFAVLALSECQALE